MTRALQDPESPNVIVQAKFIDASKDELKRNRMRKNQKKVGESFHNDLKQQP